MKMLARTGAKGEPMATPSENPCLIHQFDYKTVKNKMSL